MLSGLAASFPIAYPRLCPFRTARTYVDGPLNNVATTTLLGFVVSSMIAMGAGFTVRQIIDALRDVRLVFCWRCLPIL